MNQVLDDGEIIFFGQNLEDVERHFSCNAVDNPIRVYRKGIDKLIKIKNVRLEFDTGRLSAIQFEKDYQFKNPPAPFPEEWKNFLPIGPNKIYPKMTRDEFLSYLSAWDARAEKLGAKKVERGDRTNEEYSISIVTEGFLNMIHIHLGPSRRAGGGGIWSDSWGIAFSIASDRQMSEAKPPVLQSIAAFRDEFNTVARRPTP